MRVTELMDTPAGRDELGPPAEDVVECDACGNLFVDGNAHRCVDGWTDGRGDA